MALSNIAIKNFREGSSYLGWTTLSSSYQDVAMGYYLSTNYVVGIKFTTDTSISAINLRLCADNSDITASSSFSFRYKICTSESALNSCASYNHNNSGDGSFNMNPQNWAVTDVTISTNLAPGTYYIAIWRGSSSSRTGIHWVNPSNYSSYPSRYSNLTVTNLTYTVSYNANGGAGAPGSQTKMYGVNLTLSSTKPTKSNTTTEDTISFDGNGGNNQASLKETNTTTYTFSSWLSSSDNTNYAAGASYTTNASTTMTAQWSSSTTQSGITIPSTTRSNDTKNNVFTITYNANNGSGAPSQQTTSQTISYSLKYWTLNKDGTGSWGPYYAGTHYSNWGGSLTLYAQWDSVTTNNSLQLSSTIPTRTGYTFKGWATSSSATTATYTAGTSYTFSSNITLYAVWQANSITFKYYSNNGSQTNFVNWTAKIDSAWPDNHYNYTSGTYKQTYTGHTATGYYGTTTTGGILVGEDESFASYAEICSKYGVNIQTETSTINIYCQWKIDTYTVSYNANGGSGAPAAQTKTYGTNLTLSSTIPTRTGYKFLGWGTSSTDTTVDYAPGATYTGNAALNLYAIWKPNGTVSIDNGYSWETYLINIDEGSKFSPYVAYYDNGATWIILK